MTPPAPASTSGADHALLSPPNCKVRVAPGIGSDWTRPRPTRRVKPACALPTRGAPRNNTLRRTDSCMATPATSVTAAEGSEKVLSDIGTLVVDDHVTCRWIPYRHPCRGTALDGVGRRFVKAMTAVTARRA